jgi:hypothetical protein
MCVYMTTFYMHKRQNDTDEWNGGHLQYVKNLLLWLSAALLLVNNGPYRYNKHAMWIHNFPAFTS